MLNFVAIDFETANFKRESACQIGYAVVKDSKVVHQGQSLILPTTGSYFTFSHVHGIKHADTLGAPSWIEVMSELEKMRKFYGIEKTPYVSHNSGFDESVWDACWNVIPEPAPTKTFFDTLRLSRDHLDLKTYKLTIVAKALGVDNLNHHNALYDAVMCAEIALKISELSKRKTVEELWTPKTKATKKIAGIDRNFLELKLPTVISDNHPLRGVNVCISGDFLHFNRNELELLLESYGAIVNKSVLKKTTLLLSGASSEFRNKFRRAHDLKKKGQFIEIINEETLIELLRIA